MAPSKREILPLLPLPKDAVLLPGSVLRIPAVDRPDILALLSHTFGAFATISQRLSRPDATSMVIGCVPLNPPHTTAAGSPKRIRQTAREDGSGYEVFPDPARNRSLYHVGTAAKIRWFGGKGVEELALVVEGVRRFRVEGITQESPFLKAKVTYDDGHESQAVPDVELQTLFIKLKALAREVLVLLRLSSIILPGTSPLLSPLLAKRLELFISQKQIHEAGQLADFMANLLELSVEEKLQILAAWDVKSRLEMTVELLSTQVAQVRDKAQRASLAPNGIPRSLDIIPLKKKDLEGPSRRGVGGPAFGSIPPWLSKSLGVDSEDEGNDLDDLKRKLDSAQLSADAQKIAQRELKRLRKMNAAQAEYQVCRNYLETLSEIPWNRMTEDQLGRDSLKLARKQLDNDHYGLEMIKKRLLEYLAVLKLKQSMKAAPDAGAESGTSHLAAVQSPDDMQSKDDVGTQRDENDVDLGLSRRRGLVDKSPILLLVGPPGTGKTSLAKSVAAALGRKFHRISLGGVRDEAAIRGHRRTYVAAMPGLIVSGLRKVGVANPVFLLDEIDKIGMSNFHGDPSAAMLEVLDPEQNHTFTDHYLNVPLDLSKVLFIATANSLDTIPPPLLDRMETISLSGYTTLEKRHIARQHLVPKQIAANGLNEGLIHFADEVVDRIITSYTREAGVRNLEREIGAICRAKAVEYANAKDMFKMETYRPEVTMADLEDILGVEKFDEEIAEKVSRPGIVTGLVAYSTGGNGSILFIEVADMPGTGRVQLTGKLGDVLKESVEVALTWVKAHSSELGLTSDPTDDLMKNRSVHVHCPSGAIPKDGPSAGLAHTIALISLFSGRAVPAMLAMTGEVSLRGRVTAVGGIKEKLIGALRAGVKTVLLPAHNRKDGKDLPREVKEGLDIIYVSHIWEAVRHVWPEVHWPGEPHPAGLESRL